MTRKRLSIRLAVWTSVGVVHFLVSRWALRRAFEAFLGGGPYWPLRGVEYGLFFPTVIYERFGGRPWAIGPLTPMFLWNSVAWTISVAAAVEGVRWLWARGR
jgi:hypothetical protein